MCRNGRLVMHDVGWTCRPQTTPTALPMHPSLADSQIGKYPEVLEPDSPRKSKLYQEILDLWSDPDRAHVPPYMDDVGTPKLFN